MRKRELANWAERLSAERRDLLHLRTGTAWQATTRFVAASSIGFLWAWRYCGYKTGLLFGNVPATNMQMTPSYLADSVFAIIAIFALPALLTHLSLNGKRALAAGGAFLMSTGTLMSGFSMVQGSLAGVVSGGVASGIGSGILYVLSGLGYVYETTDRLETIVPLNMVWALLGAFAAPFLGGTSAGIVFVALLPLCAGAIIWHGLPHLEHAQLPTDMSEMPYASRRFVVAILACSVLFEVAACSRVASPLLSSVANVFGTFTLYYQVVSVITFAILIPMSLLLITSSRRFNILSTFRHMVPLLIIAAVMNLPLMLSGIQLAGAFLNAFANTYLTLALYIWAFSLAKRGAMSPRWSFSLYMGLMIVGISLGNIVGFLVPTDLSAETLSSTHVFIMVVLFAVLLLILPEKPREESPGIGRPRSRSNRNQIADTRNDASTADPSASPSLGTVPGPKTPTRQPEADMQALETPSSVTDRFAALAQAKGLTAREIEICLLLAQGRSRPYIREKLVISKSTVDTHARHAYAKLGIHTNQELIDLLEKN